MSRDERRSYWAGLLRDHEKSGLSLPAFSLGKNIRYETLRRWRSKLDEFPKGELPKVKVEIGFDELPPMVPDALPRHAPDAGCGVSVVLPSGIRLELASGFDASTLSRAALALGELRR